MEDFDWTFTVEADKTINNNILDQLITATWTHIFVVH